MKMGCLLLPLLLPASLDEFDDFVYINSRPGIKGSRRHGEAKAPATAAEVKRKMANGIGDDKKCPQRAETDTTIQEAAE